MNYISWKLSPASKITRVLKSRIEVSKSMLQSEMKSVLSYLGCLKVCSILFFRNYNDFI